MVVEQDYFSTLTAVRSFHAEPLPRIFGVHKSPGIAALSESSESESRKPEPRHGSEETMIHVMTHRCRDRVPGEPWNKPWKRYSHSYPVREHTFPFFPNDGMQTRCSSKVVVDEPVVLCMIKKPAGSPSLQITELCLKEYSVAYGFPAHSRELLANERALWSNRLDGRTCDSSPCGSPGHLSEGRLVCIVPAWRPQFSPGCDP